MISNDIVTTIKKRGTMAKERVKRLTSAQNAEKISIGDTCADIMTNGGIDIGTMLQIYGDSSSGKTLLALEIIAHAKQKFKDNLYVRYIDSENGMRFAVDSIYGYDFDKTPNFERIGARTVQEFIAQSGSFIKKLPKGKVGIVILDSLDGVGSKEAKEDYEERIVQHDKGKEHDKPTFGLEKQKFLSANLPILMSEIEESSVLFIAISQQKEKVGQTYGAKTYTTGGASPGYYSSTRLSCKEIKDPVMTIEGRSIGAVVEIFGKKTRSDFPFRTIHVPILFSFGIDSVGSNIDFLYGLRPIEGQEKGKLDTAKAAMLQWSDDPTEESIEEITTDMLKEFLVVHDVEAVYKGEYGRFYAKKCMLFINEYEEKDLRTEFVKQFGVMDRGMLIAYIEDNDLEEELAKRVTVKWHEIENRIRPTRKARF